MADANKVVEFVLRNEGGWSDHPADRGGRTRFGISSAANPDVDLDSLTLDKAVDIILQRYYYRYNIHLLKALPVACKGLDVVYWMGGFAGARTLQRALMACHNPVAIDGIIGPITAGKANAMDTRILLPPWRSEIAGQVRRIIYGDPSQEPFREGWLKRAYL